MSEIQSIIGLETMRPGEYPTYWKVGVDGVTRIEFRERNYGTYGIGEYHIFKGEHRHATMTHMAVGDIYYAEGSSDE